MQTHHQSVLLNEIVEAMDGAGAGVAVDGTLGAGGHAKALLDAQPMLKLIGLDRDEAAIRLAGTTLNNYAGRVTMVHADFRHMSEVLKKLGIRQADRILLDLGVSSMQFDEAERGFTFRQNAALDMRMDTTQKLTAQDIVNTFSKEELLDIIFKLGEERFARKIVDRIMRARQDKPIRTTADLSSLIEASVPARYRFGRIHPATRTFQALRIAVNGELDALKEFLASVQDILAPGGKLAIISFHSLEDRIVKWAYKEFEKNRYGKMLTKKPITPGDAEVRSNPRARSAKLRVFQKAVTAGVS